MQFSDLDLTKTYSYADYLSWSFNERLELIKGKIFKMSPAPSRKHQKVSMTITREFSSFLKGKRCEVYAAPFDVRMSGQKDERQIITVLQPDVCVICDPSKLDDRGCLGAPDIVVEILSPGNNQKELQNKYDVYEEAGVKEYWIIHPDERTFLRYILSTENKFIGERLLTIGDFVQTPVLSGFELNLTEVFEGLD